MDIAALKQRLVELNARASAIQAKADEETRDLTAEEEGELEGIFAEFERTEGEIKRRERIENQGQRLGQSAGRQATPNAPASNNAPAPAPAGGNPAPRDGLMNTRLPTERERGRNGFAHAGEFFTAVRNARVRNNVDPRLVQNAATSWGGEAVGEDGGFAVPPDWRNEIMDLVGAEDSLLTRTDQQITSSNQLVVPTDQTAPWHSAGVRVYWVDEATAPTQTKPKLTPKITRANKLAGLVYLTDELLEDAASMGNYVRTKAPAAISWAINDAIINGDGVGKPQGIMNSGALVTVSKEGSQAADTLLGANVSKMWARMPARSIPRAVWLINQDLYPQLHSLNIPIKNIAGDQNVGGVPVFVPPGGFSAAPYGTLLGRPIIPTEACAAIGDLGDIIFADMMGYLSVMKSGGVRQDVSIHVEFEKDMTAFRFILRMGGQAWLDAPIARKNGSNTLSTFVTLEAR